MKKGWKVRWFAFALAIVFAGALVNGSLNKFLFASGGDERIVFAYGKTLAQGQEISIFVNEEQATLLEITTPTKDVSKLPVNTEINYEINTNGIYTFTLLDKDNNEIARVEQDFRSLKKLDIIEKPEEWEIISRVINVTQVEASCGETKEVIALTNDGHGNHFVTMPIPQAASCRFTPLEATGAPAGDVFEYVKKTKEAGNESSAVPLKKQITTAKDLHLISEQPDGIYEVSADIDMSGMKTLDVIFSGTLLGNGYQFYNMQQPLFLKMENAEVNNLHLQGEMESEHNLAGFALQGTATSIKGSSFQGAIVSEKEAAGFFVTGDNVSIENSYVSAKIEAKTSSAGFFTSGNGNVKESYVSGVIKAEENAFGFGKDIEARDSYVAANIFASSPYMFNEEKVSIEGCFYDASLNDFEETRANAFSNNEMLSSNLDVNDVFETVEGKYPQITEEVREIWSEKSKDAANMSVFALPLEAHQNMATLENSLTLPTTMDEQSKSIEWDHSGKAKAEIIAVDEEVKKEDTIFMAKTDEGTRYFATRNAQVLASDDILVGERAATPTTTISFNATDAYYYKVAKADEVVNQVTTHKDAIDAGFKKRIGTGVFNFANMEWNTKYKVYETDLTTMTTREATTKYGMLGGSMSVEGDVKVGESIQANIQDTLTTSGTWTWFKSQKLDSGWTQITGESSSAHIIKADELGYYIKTVFTSDPTTNIQDSIEYIQKTIVKQDLDAGAKVSLIGNAEIGGKLTANFEGSLDKDDFNIQWYHKSTGSDDIKIGSGLQHDIVAADVGKQIYIIASTKAESNYIGSITSDPTAVIISLAMPTPADRPTAVPGTLEDTTVKLKMPETVKDGLYRFGYQATGEDLVEFPITVRSDNPLTITGLTPGKLYSFKVKRIGENGYLDSAWSARGLNLTMGSEYIKGYLDLTGNAVFGEMLKVEFKTEDMAQTTTTSWYRVKDGKRIGDAIATGNTYVLKAEDVGCKIEVETIGINNYSGFVNVFSETVVRAFVSGPTGAVTEKATGSNSVQVQLPALDSGMSSAEDKFIIGISESESGYPIEYNAGSGVEEYNQSSIVDLVNLKPATNYYIYLRYAMTGSHYRSDWSTSKKVVKTTQESFAGTINFGYTTNTDAIQGEKISAKVTSTNTGFEYMGTWEWYRVLPNATEEKISNFYPETDVDGNELKNETFFIIPENEAVGTKYRVVYKPDIRYTGSTTSTSNLVKAPIKEVYDAPSKPDEVSHSDAAITLKMPSSLTGIYQFGYSLKADGSDIVAVEATALAGAEVSITGLNRNTTYYVYSRRNGDEDKSTSPWSTSSLQVKTDLTNISGYISLDENANYGTKLTATYNSASYAPVGDDSKGKWQWHRNNVAISGATTNTYTPVQADIGTVIKVTYTASGTEGFKGSKDASTKAVQKAIQSNPNKVVISGTASLGSKPGINVKFHPSDTVYYRLQKASDAAPSVPLSSAEIASAKWTPSPKVTTDLYADYAGATLLSNIDYIVYVVKVETTTDLASSIVASDAISPNTLAMSGTVAITGEAVVGKTLTATLKNSNNTAGKGTWKWYRSTQSYPTISSMPSVTDTTKWTQIASGYVPTKDSLSSTYTVTNADFGYYMKAEFVAEETVGYKGTLQVGNSYNKKIFDEEVTIEGKGYPGETITIKLNGSRTVGELTTKKVRIMNGSTKIVEYEGTRVDDQTFTATIPNNTTTQGYPDGYTVLGTINVPNGNLYVKADGSSFTGTETLTDILAYKGGIPITNANDLENFIKASGSYTNRSSKYVVTNNINLSSKGVITPAASNFTGTFDGDFHTIVGQKGPFFNWLKGTFKNTILQNANCVSAGSGSSSDSMSPIAMQAQSASVSKVFVADPNVTAGWDAGMMFGRSSGNIKVEESGMAGGLLKTTANNANIAAVVGWSDAPDTNIFSDLFVTNVDFETTSNTSGISGITFQATHSKLTNVYVASKLDKTSDVKINSAIAIMNSYNASTKITTFYDSTLTPKSGIGGVSGGKFMGEAKITQDLIGENLKPVFNKDEVWRYNEGFYPQLKWINDVASKNSPNAQKILDLHTSTRGSFVPIDGKTTATELFNGILNGSASLPPQLQTSGFSYTSNNPSVISVSKEGVVTPKSNGTATISVTFSDSNTGSTTTRSYEFSSNASMSSYDSILVSGTPGVGNSFTSTILPSSAVSGSSYQWYRKQVDSANSTATEISGATSASYTPKSTDLGYQLQVKVSQSGYGTSLSNWSDTVVISAPTAAPAISSITESGFVVTGKGSSSTDYEYGYAESTTGEKIVYPTKGASATFIGMQRNKDYYIFSRIAGGTGYEASAWSPSAKVTTLKTNLVGAITPVSSYNAGSDLILSLPDTNLQTGTWKIERTNGSTYTDVTSLATTNSTYQLIYPLKTADVGNYFRVTYTGNGDFQSSLTIAKTTTIKNQMQSAPSEPAISSKTDSSLSVKIASPESGATYSFGYRKSLTDSITAVSGSGSTATLSGLTRNTNYYIYAKKNAKSGYEESDWGPAVLASTDRTNLSGSITQSGSEQTEGTLVFTAPGSKGETGRWNLERFTATETTTLDNYTLSPDGRTLTYKAVPEDTGKKLRATFNGTLDFQASLSKESGVISTKGQDALTTQPSVVSSSEYYLEVIMNTGTDMFQFGYRLKGDAGAITLFPATTAVGKSAIITGLKRNSEYEIYVRKAAKTGYDASGWNTNPMIGKTSLSPLNGNISFTGNAIVGQSVIASFDTNGYPQTGDDSKGTWSWYLDGVKLSETSSTLVIPSYAKGNPELKVMYDANTSDGFQGTISRSIGKLSKTAFASPTIPTVTALAEDDTQGSKIQVTNANVDDVYYYVQSSDLSVEPSLVLASETTTTIAPDTWVKATTDMVFNLEPNKGYQLFAARLETDTKGVSTVVTGKSVRTVKEALIAPVEDKDVSITWKADQPRTLYYTQYGDAPIGTWSIYIANDLTSDWQNIDAQLFEGLKQGVENNQAYVTISLPMKFTGNYVKAVFTGLDDFTGSQEYISRSIDDVDTEGKLIGQAMEGHVEILNPDTNELLVPIDVQYVGDDEKSGIWTWYRETAESSEIYEVIAGATNTGVTSQYIPTAADFSRNIYAVYSANPKGLFSGQQQSDSIKQVKRSGQNKADPVTIKEVNGTRVLVSPPTNFKSDVDGTMPQVVLGYKEAKDKNDASAPITWQLSANYGNNWFSNLKVNTAYVFYAKFLGTPTYDVSVESDASAEAITQNESFVNTSLKLQKNHDVANTYIMDVGNSITATYSDNGWDEGYFRIKRSNGEIISEHVDAVVTKANEASCSYAYQNADIGTHIIIEYVAKDDALYHSGSIVTATSEPVTKPVDTSMPIAPTLTSSGHTTLQLDAVNAKYEYVLNESATAPEMSSGAWDKLPAADAAAYEFANVKAQNEYYIHVRIAETASSAVGDKTATAGPFKVDEAIDLGTITLANTEDETIVPMDTSGAVTIPNVLKSNTVTIKNVKMSKNGVDVSYPQTSINEYLDGNQPHENVFVKGSDWGNQHFASNIQVIDELGDVVSSSKGDGTSLDNVTSTSSIQLQMYRVNAVKESGTYEWTCDLEDTSGNVASYKAEIKVETQIKAMIPIKLEMYIRDGYINQTSNNEVLVNDGMMPLSYQMDEYAQPGNVSMPNLLGVFNKPLESLGRNEVFLKISSDGSNFTKNSGVWMRTDGVSQPKDLVALGAKSKAGYLISGISDKGMNWPWESADNRIIQEAYLFHFIIDVNKEDINMNQTVIQP